MHSERRSLITLLVALLVGTGVLSLWSSLKRHAQIRQTASSSEIRRQLPAGALARLDRAVEADALSMRTTLMLEGLLIAGGLAVAVFAFGRGTTAAGPEASQTALDAYEEAMERMRDQRAREDALHEGEMRRFMETLADKETMARAGELTAGMAHEVRNSLSTIQGNARLLQPGAAAAGAQESVAAILAECDQLQSSIKSFVDFIRQEKPEFLPLDLERLLRRVAAREQRVREGPAIAVHAAVAPGVLLADEGLLERAFENLVRNAREAGSGSGQVEVHATQDETYVIVDVKDEGPGPSPVTSDLGRPFVTTKPGGLGLGLPTAIKIIQLHGGTLSLAKREDTRGAVARVRLPLPIDRVVT